MNPGIRRAATCISVAVLFVLTGMAAGARPSTDFEVQFSQCAETIGVGLVSTDAARQLVPSGFILVGEGTPVTPIVVRTARCADIVVDGHSGGPGTVVQIGLVIVPPDVPAFIDNYTIWYYTTDPNLAARLHTAGVNAQHVQRIDSTLDMAQGKFHLAAPLPGKPSLAIDGSVGAPVPAGSFEANWWIKTHHGVVKMDTLVPDISIGPADLLLSTPPSSGLANLVGGSVLGFPIIQQFNLFPAAHMHVSVR